MRALWQGILEKNSAVAMKAFFPEAAYVQLKAIGDPSGDWEYRLVGDFKLDLSAAHRYIFSSPKAKSARLVGVLVAEDEVAWIPPGYCYNSIGYWHAPGARVVYREHGQEMSFGIASLISWRGVWYVVHLGAVLRTVVTGIVDQPAAGPGVPGPPGGC
jgi:hypothetical protein